MSAVPLAMRAWGKVLAQGNAEWKFAPPNGFEFFHRHGWSLTAGHPFFAQARRLHRDTALRFAWLVRVLSSLSEQFRSGLENSVIYGIMEPSSG